MGVVLNWSLVFPSLSLPRVARLKSIFGPTALEVLRCLERVLPPAILYRLVNPIAVLRAFVSIRPASPWPDALVPAGAGPIYGWKSSCFHMDQVLQLLPDRLCTARWRKRCQIHGWHHLEQARGNGQPVVLAFTHVGPYFLTGFWLRAHGIPVTALMMGSAKSRSGTRRYKDRYLPFPTIPCVVYANHLKELVKAFSAGATPLIAIDVPTGRLLDVPFGEGQTFQLATGAMRLAARHGAALIPCHIIRTGSWRFRIELCQPVPPKYLAGVPDLVAAGQHLLAESLPLWRRHPEQCQADVVRILRGQMP